MILSFIKFKKSQSELERVWRFSTPKGSSDHLAILSDNDESVLEDLSGALRQAFDSSAAADGSTPALVSVGFSDDDGQTWQLDWQSGVRKAWCNGQAVDMHRLSAVIPWISARNTNERSQVFRLFPHRESTSVRPLNYGTTKDQASVILRERCSVASQRIAALMEEPILENPQNVLALAERIGLCMVQITEIESLLAKIREGSSLHQDESALRKLSEELVLVEKMKILVGAISKGTENGSSLKSDLEQCEAELDEITRQFGILEDQVESFAGVNWAELIAAAARAESNAQLMRVGEDNHKTLCEVTVPHLAKSLEKLRGILETDEQLAQDLNFLIGKSAEEARRPRTVFEKIQLKLQDVMRHSIAERIGSMAGKSPRTEALHADQIALAADRAQNSASEAYACINEMIRHLDRTKEGIELTVDNNQTRQEKLTKEVSRARAQWRALAERNRLPTSLTLDQVIELASGHLSIRKLIEKRESLMGRQHSRREQLIELQKQVIEWRRHTGSQKQSDIKTASILLNEARSICQYLEEKQESHRRMLEAREAARARESALVQLKTRHQDLLAHWNRACAEVGISERSHQDGRWMAFLKGAQEIKALTAITGETKELVVDEFLDQRGETGSLAIYLSTRPKLSPAHADHLVDTFLARGRHCGLHLVLSTDHELSKKSVEVGASVGAPTFEKAGAVGASKTRPVVPEVKTHSPTSSSTNENVFSSSPGSEQTSIISPRARAVLDLLNSPRALPPKGPRLNSKS